ncbi:heme o synthase [Candidatus Cyanaurora vandensis]|uniref:heme o synthase n=1 Tax=Candidatus Cyanaurora vandensis TaxID=2714958 RepID=UPI00257C5A34|nr:heme o synthase [Candidatus Cyanaurora vandensis]
MQQADLKLDSSWQNRVADYVQLTKPRIISLLLITTAGAMWLAGRGHVDPVLLLTTILGGALAACSANTFNCVIDRDIDQLMERTRNRPLPAGRLQPGPAIVFGVFLAGASFVTLATFANLLSAFLAQLGILFYVLVYSFWLKRTTPQNIVIGGAAGAIPPLVGWAAVTGRLDWSALALFMIIFLWTPPHFWALAMFIGEDYRKAGVPMLPVVAGNRATTQQMFFYTVATVVVTLLLFPLGVTGWVYLVGALGLGLVFIQRMVRLMGRPDDLEEARSLFRFSIFYLMLLFVTIGVDSIRFLL